MMTSQIKVHRFEHIPNLNCDRLAINTRYRDHPHLSEADHKSLLLHELRSAVSAGGMCASMGDINQLSAICAIKPLKWDSQHFGLPMAALTVAVEPAFPPKELAALVKFTLASIAHLNGGSLHISAELDVDDYPSMNTLVHLGFEIMDFKREFRWTSLKGVPVPKFLTQVRDYRPADKSQVMDILNEVSFKGRFSRDTAIPLGKAEEMYAAWLDRLLDNDDSTTALVFEQRGAVQACGVIEKTDLSCAGVSIQFMDKGLYLSRKNSVGGYYPVIYSLATHSLARYSSVQTSVSLNNHSAVRVLERMNGGTRTTRIALRLSLNQ